MTNKPPEPGSLVDVGHIGEAGIAAVTAALLAEGFQTARPFPNPAGQLIAFSPRTSQPTRLQVFSATSRALRFDRQWFSKPNIFVVIVWLRSTSVRFFLFRGENDVEEFVKELDGQDGWFRAGTWGVHNARTALEGRLGVAEDRWRAFCSGLSSPPLQLLVKQSVVRLTRHARERVEAGEVREEWIAATLSSPDHTDEDPLRPGIRRAWKRIEDFGSRALRVAYRQEGAVTVVITAFFDRGAPT
jgi:hypothetical protein